MSLTLPIPLLVLLALALGAFVQPRNPRNSRRRLDGEASPSVWSERPQQLPNGTEHVDLLILGGGPAGLAAGVRARRSGASVVILERRKKVGGTCANVGCDPTVIFWNAAQTLETIRQAPGFGFDVGDAKFSMRTFKDHRDRFLSRFLDAEHGFFSGGLADLTFVTGADARFIGPRLVQAGDRVFAARRVVIAVGARPPRLDVPGAELAIISDDLIDVEDLPKRVAIVGAGYVAMEYAGILSTLGVRVDIFMRSESILSGKFEPAITQVPRATRSKAGRPRSPSLCTGTL